MENFENLNVSELDSASLQSLDGGLWIPPQYFVVAGIYVDQAVDDFVDNFKEGVVEAMQ